VSARSPRQDQLNDGNAQRADSDGIGTLEASQPDAPRRSLRSLRTVVAGDDLIRPLRSSPPHHRPSPNLLVLAKNDPALQKRDTKKARGDRRRKCQIPHTETSSYLRNLTVPRGFKATFICDALETDWLAGAAGLEPLHLRSQFAKTLSSGREHYDFFCFVLERGLSRRTRSPSMKTSTSRRTLVCQPG
jgi:hypothetical protein